MTLNDWRGTPIAPGDLVLYGAGVGRSIALVEATVESIDEDKKRVSLRVIRRAYGGGEKPVVSVGHDRLTVVPALAPSTVPTQDEHRHKAILRSIDYHKRRLNEPEEDWSYDPRAKYKSSHDYYMHCLEKEEKELAEVEERLGI